MLGPTLTCPCSMNVAASRTVSDILSRTITTAKRRLQNAAVASCSVCTRDFLVGRMPISCNLQDQQQRNSGVFIYSSSKVANYIGWQAAHMMMQSTAVYSMGVATSMLSETRSSCHRSLHPGSCCQASCSDCIRDLIWLGERPYCAT